MSDPNNSGNGGQSLGGNRENLPSNWSRSGNSGPRIARIGDWGASSGSSSRSGGPRMATLSDLNSSGQPGRSPRSSDDDDDDDEDDNGDGENWFAGGERSGLSVQNPDHRSNIPGGELVKELLRKAKQSGPPAAEAESSSSVGRAFTGGGHTLGGEDVESQFVPDPNAPPGQASPEVFRAIRHLTFWRDGFSVEDGPLLRYDDPANADTLKAIDEGQAPPQLLNVEYGQPVELRVARRIDEDYKPPPKRPMRAFEGSGQRLGAPIPDFAPSVPGAFPSASGSGSGQASSGPAPTREPQSVQTKFEVDQSKPTTSIQLRLTDGTRLVCRMNMTHTVRDIRNFINAARPENLTRPYTIETTFPKRVLEDDNQTIETAGLRNSVVLQRWA